MLERASSCVEPVSHLILRRLERPVRSRRVLGPAFWKNGADELSVPCWWPLYLDNIRRKSKSQNRVENGRPLARSRHAATNASCDQKPSSSFGTDTTSYSNPARRLSRAYIKPTKYDEKLPNSRYLNTNAAAIRPDSGVEGQLHDYPENRRPALLSTCVKESSNYNASKPVSDDARFVQESRDLEVKQSSLNSLNPDSFDARSGDIAREGERELLQILDNHKYLGYAAEKDNKFEVAWALFRRLPDQETHAAQVFHFMSHSTAPQELKHALRAFKLIPLEKRSAADYERAVRTAIQRNDYRQAISINAEATSRQLNQDCSTFLLLHTSSHQLWNAAAKIWSTSFEPLTRNRQRLSSSPIGRLLLKQVDKYQNLPLAVSSLAKEILERRAVVMHQAGILLHLGRELLHVLVKSGRLMSITTPATLVAILDHYTELQLLNPTVHLDAVNTLLKSARRPDRGNLAGLIYRHLRSKFPHFQPSPSLYGAVFSILADEDAPFEVYKFWLREFAHLHSAADKRSYQKVLTALAAQGDVDGVQTVFMELCTVHSRPTDVAYLTPLLYVYARLGDIEGTEREFQRLTEWRVRPTLYCWNILLYAYARSAEPERAFDVFEKIKAEGLRPDIYTFGTLMGIVARRGDVDAVLEMIEQAQQHQIKGNYDMICGLVHSYCLNDQADIAERLAEATTMANLEGEPVKMWNYLLRHHAFESDSEAVLRVQQSMNSLGVKPDDMTYAALMAALVVIGKTRDAAQILKSLRESPTLTTTSFHYSIVLQGFVQEGNLEMADNVWQEMARMFPRLTPSSRLAMLHLQGLRSLNTNDRPYHASDYLAVVLHELATQDRATKHPQPGFGRHSPVNALPSIYVESMAGILASNGRTEQADKLLRRYESLSQSSYLNLDRGTQESIALLTTRLIIATQQRNWQMVEKTWRQILDRAVKAASPYSAKRERHATKDETARTSTTMPDVPKGVDLIGGPEFSFTSMISNSAPSIAPSADSPLDRPGVKVLFSQRYVIEAPITRYLRALDIQGLHQNAVELVEKLENVGFSLTNKNWNFYVQMLTRSSDPKHWVHAFKVFEDKFIANTPPWRHLRAGKWSTPSCAKAGTPGALELYRRKTLEKLDKGHLMPTYVTAVHLATILLESNRRAARGDVFINVDLWRSAPETYRYIRRIPRSKDRIQGGVLRGRNILGDLQKRSGRASQRQPKQTKISSEAHTKNLGNDEAQAVGNKWLPFKEPKAKKKGRPDDPPPVHGALFDAHDRRLEKRAESQKKLRDQRSTLIDEATRHRKSTSFNPRKFEAVVSLRLRGRGRAGPSGKPTEPQSKDVLRDEEQPQAVGGND